MARQAKRRYGDGAVFERADGRWVARVELGVTADGKRVNEKTLKRHLDGQCLCPPESPHRGVYRAS